MRVPPIRRDESSHPELPCRIFGGDPRIQYTTEYTPNRENRCLSRLSTFICQSILTGGNVATCLVSTCENVLVANQTWIDRLWIRGGPPFPSGDGFDAEDQNPQHFCTRNMPPKKRAAIVALLKHELLLTSSTHVATEPPDDDDDDWTEWTLACESATKRRKIAEQQMENAVMDQVAATARRHRQMLLLLTVPLVELRRSPRWWVKLSDPCWTAWWDDVYYNPDTQFDDGEWLQNFRMRRATFERLVDEVRGLRCMHKNNTKFRAAVPVEKRVAAAIFRLANGACSHRQIRSVNLPVLTHWCCRQQFGMGATTSHNCFWDFGTACEKHLQRK